MSLAVVPGAPLVTLDGLLAHAQKYGLDIDAKGRGRYSPRHKSWRSLYKEAIVEVAIEGLGLESFTLFVEGIGYREHRDAARAEWHDRRNLDPEVAE